MMAFNKFTLAMSAAGLAPADLSRISQSGELNRYQVENDKPGTLNGWCVFHPDNLAAGAFGSWRTGETHTWRESSDRPIDAAQQAKIHAQISEARAQRDRDQADRHAKAANRAAVIWASAKITTQAHSYLIRKGVSSVHGLRILDRADPWNRRGSLLVPCSIKGKLSSLQFIAANGDKRFLPGGQKRGGYFLAGALHGSEYVAIVEGIATGISVHEATGWPVAVAFDAGNLHAVGEAIQYRHPALTLVFCADNDTETQGNPGLAAAKHAAEKLGSVLALAEALGGCATDWNDFSQHCGIDATRAALHLATGGGNV